MQVHFCENNVYIFRVPTDLESHGINLVGENPGILLMVRKNYVYSLSCMTVVYFC